jgi:phosphohistidine swiveling domain-containing protein
MPRYVFPLNSRRLPATVGEKVKNLRALQREGFRVPATYAVSWDLQKVYLQNGNRFPDAFLEDLKGCIDPGRTYAVRSSANVEDSHAKSYAGQFLTLLDVQGVENILEAVREVWASANQESARSYRSRAGDGGKIEMGVAFQEMVPARLSGVAFSRNPITGMDEIVVEAVAGSGAALMQDGVTPQRWIWKWGKWLQQPEKTDVSLALVQEIVVEVKRISETFHYPVDVEWAFDGQRVTWLQMRKITTLPNTDIYSNHFSKEFIPGVIKPLVWTVNIPLVNGAWVQLLTELIGENDLDPLRLARSFYGHAYFNMGVLGTVFQKIGLPDNALERLMGFKAEASYGPSFQPSWKALQHLPRLVKFIVKKAWYGRTLEKFIALAQRQYEAWASQSFEDISDSDIEDILQRIYQLNQRAAYFNIVTPILMHLYHRLAKRDLMHKGFDYESVNWLEGWQEREAYDPAPHLQAVGAMYHALTPAERQVARSPDQGSFSAAVEDFKRRFGTFMDRFGHLSDNGNDFSYPSWAETPEAILNIIANDAPEENTRRSHLSKSASPRGFFYPLAARYSRYREQISFLYTRGFSLFRAAYLRLGDRLCRSGWLNKADDIFFLEHGEIFAALQNEILASSLCELVSKRKKEHARNQSILLPTIIYGNDPPPIQEAGLPILTGIPASRGLHRGIVRVVKGLGDFHKVSDDCVLVIPYSDVSWTPLFARAGAVIAEAGGVLSHCSIIAREYGIPAVVSAAHATHLRDGSEVTVDGYSGRIIVHDANFGKENDAG